MKGSVVKRVAFVLLSCAILLGAAKWIPAKEAPPQGALPAVFVCDGYAAATETPLDENSLQYAGKKFRQLYESDLTANEGRIYLSVIPDKGSFMMPPDGYVPASADETANALLEQLDFVQYADIAPLLTLEDYYRTDPHWRQERLAGVAQALLEAMGRELTQDFQEHTMDVSFYGVYARQTDIPLTADTLRYLTDPALEACTVYDYETQRQEALYDLSAVDTDTPYDLYLRGSKSLLRVDSPLSATDKTLVVFRDSFASSLIPLLAQQYRTIYAVDIRYLASQLVSRYVTLDGSEDVLFLYSVMVLNNSKTIK